MGLLHDELLELAADLAMRQEEASLRRAISTAYYALFHLLICETTLNWKRPEQRSALARTFEHNGMKEACKKKASELKAYLRTGPPQFERETAEALQLVADTFVSLQEHRKTADYDSASTWSPTDTIERVISVGAAFERWQTVRQSSEAQDFLLSLFVKKR